VARAGTAGGALRRARERRARERRGRGEWRARRDGGWRGNGGVFLLNFGGRRGELRLLLAVRRPYTTGQAHVGRTRGQGYLWRTR